MGSKNQVALTKFFQLQVLFILFIALFGCNVGSQPQDTASTPISPASSNSEPLTPEPLSDPLWQWNGIIPGQSTPEDVEAILGPPRDAYDTTVSTNQGTSTRTYWHFEPFLDQPAPLCSATCSGRVRIIFSEGKVLFINLTFDFSSAATIREAIVLLGEPELFGGNPFIKNHPTLDYYREQGLTLHEIQQLVNIWQAAYPSKGLLVDIGPNYMDEGITTYLYPLGDFPPTFTPVRGVELFEPMELEKYKQTELIHDFMLFPEP